MNDLIRRQDAVKSMTNAIWHYPNEMYAQLNSYEMAEALAKDGLMFIPSAQPNVHDFPKDADCISRQAATTLPVIPKEHREYQTSNLDDAYEQGWNDLQKCIESLPSAQPEDWMEKNKERILQAGMEGREIEFRICGRLFAIREKAQ